MHRMLLLIMLALPARATLLEDDLPRRGVFGAAVDPARGGATVERVLDGSAAAAAGLRAGDRIVSIDGTPLRNEHDWFRLMKGHKGGDKVRVGIARGNEKLQLDAQLKPWPLESGEGYSTVYGSVKSGAHRLRTLLTRPAGKGPFPALFLVQGIGCFSVDNQPVGFSYQKLIEALTRKGFVTLRVDKPGAGDSEGGDCAASSFSTEVRGYQAALAALGQIDFIDKARVYLFGHSLGGVMAPLVAQALPVKGIAVYGTVHGSWLAYELENGQRQDWLHGKTPAEVAAIERAREQFLTLFYVQKMPMARIAAEHKGLLEKLGRGSERYYAAGKVPAYFQDIYATDFATPWTTYSGDLLVLWGTSDFLSSEADHKRLAAEMEGIHPGKVTYQPVRGVDHWFEKAATMKESLAKGPGGEQGSVVAETLIEFVTR